MTADNEQLQSMMRASFEANLATRVRRASAVRLQTVIPTHWFSAAASECAVMFISGHFYGAISVSQAYVEALGKYLAEKHQVLPRKPKPLWIELQRLGIVSADCLAAALSIYAERHHFHHLNKEVRQDHSELQRLAEACINNLHTVESEIFAYSIEAGVVGVANPDYWPSLEGGLTSVYVRNLT
jgi:hypothetical protein